MTVSVTTKGRCPIAVTAPIIQADSFSAAQRYAMTLAVRSRIDPYSVTAQIGASGMGEGHRSVPASGEECVRER